MNSAISWMVPALFLVPAPQADAQGYPARPVRLIVPFTPGGGTDILARVVATRLSESLGQSFVVDNRPGAGGTIGMETVVRANPDGYTLIVVNSNYSATAAIQKLPYDPVSDVQPIVLFGETGLVLVVHPSMPVKNIREFIAHARSSPGKLNYGSVGNGSLTHLALELLKLETKIDLVHVPYKGGSPALNAVIGAEVQLTAIGGPATIPHVKAGRLRALGVTTARRFASMPDVPAIGETVPGYEADHWYGMWGPKGLAREIIARLNKEAANVLRTEEMRGRLAAEGLDPAGGPPEEFQRIIRRDVEKWKRVVREMKITVQ
ncbi:MAG TPA: tripartite tricarboxylate transporter substrate binding protein [Burkholderiales bacterium]|nr:tripartite tricarboxylate transporter substrate binding protein [Burkholderiales bacterium]